MPTSSPTSTSRHHTTVIHARIGPDQLVDEAKIRNECSAVIAAFVLTRPGIDVIATHCTPDLFIVLDLTSGEDPVRVETALNSAADHVIRAPGRFGLLHAHQTTALTDATTSSREGQQR